MKKNAYDRKEASNLLPLLRSVGREIRERSRTVGVLLHQLDDASRNERPLTDDGRSLQADLAIERRELRLAKRELTRLGCTLDEDHPFRILIPGEKGNLIEGFTWKLDDTSIRPAPANLVN